MGWWNVREIRVVGVFARMERGVWTWGVDVHGDVLGWAFAFEVEELCDDDGSDLVVDLSTAQHRTDKNDIGIIVSPGLIQRPRRWVDGSE